MERIGISTAQIAERTLATLGNQQATGRELTLGQRLMAMTATAQATSDYYGPGPTEMEVQPVELPETVKGALARHTG